MTAGRIGRLAALAMVVLTAGEAARADEAVSFQPGPCPATLAATGRSLQCGRIEVPQSRGVAAGIGITLPVVIVKAARPVQGAPPVIYLHGGPGGGVVADLAEDLSSPFGRELVAQDQDWVFFDQRGADGSEPALDCGDLALNDAGPASAAVVVELAKCARRWKLAGVEFRHYNSVAIARDVQDLSAALGLQSFDVYAYSYGTRIAFALLTHAPQGVHSVVMDSPWPPEAVWTESEPVMVSREVRQVLAQCAADRTCAGRYGDVETKLDGLLERLLAGPLQTGGRRYTSDMLALYLMDALYERDMVAAMPRSIWRLAGGDFGPLARYVEGGAGADYAEALHLAVLCNEELPFEDAGRVRALAAGDPIAEALGRTMTNYFPACAEFDPGVPDAIEQRPVRSDVPTLFLAAGIDAGCPADLSEVAVKSFGHGQLVVAEQSTHGVARNSACARKIVRSFLTDPAAKADQSCLAGEAIAIPFD